MTTLSKKIDRYNSLIVIAALLSILSYLFSFYPNFSYSIYAGIGLLVIAIIVMAIATVILLISRPKLLVGYIFLIVFIVIIWIYIFFIPETNFLVAGFTLILVIVTAWYASMMNDQIVLSTNQMSGRYMAEICQLIFSPMQNDLKKVKKMIINDAYIARYDHENYSIITEIEIKAILAPSHYLSENILILDNPQSKQGITLKAASILQVPDDALQHKYLPKLMHLSADYDQNYKNLKININTIFEHYPSIKDDFSTYCKSFNPELFDKCYPFDIFCALFYNIITQKTIINNGLGFPGYINFSNEHKKELLEWLKTCKIKDDVFAYLSKKEEFCTTIDEIIITIDNLMNEWRIKYFLLLTDIHLKEPIVEDRQQFY